MAIIYPYKFSSHQHKYWYFLFLNVAPSQNVVIAPGASIRINTLCAYVYQI